MKRTTLSKMFLAYILLWSGLASAVSPTYSDLQMKNYDDMKESVNALVTEAQNVADEDMDQAKNKLKDALQLIFTRPNSDNMVSQLVPAVRTPLRNVEAYETTIKTLADSAISTAKNKKSTHRDVATALIILQNIMSELKPDIKTNKTVKAIFVSIRDAKIKLDKKVNNELRMRAMIKISESPSDTAKKIIGHEK